jgi:Ca-activated chloride channel family protein
MSFGSPYLLLGLLLVPAAVLAHQLAERRRMRYAVAYTNVDVLAQVVGGGRPWRRWLLGAAFLLTLAALCLAVARPHVRTLVAKENATVVLVLDVSGSMQAQDVKPTRLAAAQRALHTFLERVPPRLKVGLILFAGEPVVATPPTTDHELVSQAINDAGLFRGYGGTAIGDAVAAAVQLGLRSAGVRPHSQTSAAPAQRSLASYRSAPKRPASSLVSILFLSDGAQTRGLLQPLEGAGRAKAAGIPVYTIALGTTGNTTLRGFPPSGTFGPQGFNFSGRGLAPDPTTLRDIADATGGKFFRAKSAGAVKDAYSRLGSSLGRTPGTKEVTDWFLAGAAGLLVLTGVLGGLWAPRLP